MSEQIPLVVLNMHSKGMSLKDAWAKYNGTTETAPKESSDSKEEKKLTASEKKEAMKAEFEALGAECPPDGDSVAKWEQALTAAKALADESAEDADESIM